MIVIGRKSHRGHLLVHLSVFYSVHADVDMVTTTTTTTVKIIIMERFVVVEVG